LATASCAGTMTHILSAHHFKYIEDGQPIVEGMPDETR
jgi:hypothetical protein